MTFQRIAFSIFLSVRKSISGLRKFSSTERSTKPRSCGMISLKSSRPSVQSTLPVTTVPSGFVFDIRTQTFVCSVIYLFS